MSLIATPIYASRTFPPPVRLIIDMDHTFVAIVERPAPAAHRRHQLCRRGPLCAERQALLLRRLCSTARATHRRNTDYLAARAALMIERGEVDIKAAITPDTAAEHLMSGPCARAPLPNRRCPSGAGVNRSSCFVGPLIRRHPDPLGGVSGGIPRCISYRGERLPEIAAVEQGAFDIRLDATQGEDELLGEVPALGMMVSEIVLPRRPTPGQRALAERASSSALIKLVGELLALDPLRATAWLESSSYCRARPRMGEVIRAGAACRGVTANG